MAEELTGIKKAIRDIIVSVIADPKVEAMVDRLITGKFLPLINVAIGAAVKSAIDTIVEKTPGLSGVVDGVKAVDDARDKMNEMLAEVNLPLIGNLGDLFGSR